MKKLLVNAVLLLVLVNTIILLGCLISDKAFRFNPLLSMAAPILYAVVFWFDERREAKASRWNDERIRRHLRGSFQRCRQLRERLRTDSRRMVRRSMMNRKFTCA